MISPGTSGEILTSTSGLIFPVALTVSVTFIFVTSLVSTSKPLSPPPMAPVDLRPIKPKTATTIIIPMMIKVFFIYLIILILEVLSQKTIQAP